MFVRAIVEVQPAGAEDLGGEPELLLPVADDRPAEERLRPGVHLRGHAFGRLEEHLLLVDRQLQVALVVERHGGELAECVLAVEHPAVRSGEQRVGDVADALVHRRGGLGARARALDPLPLQVGGNRAAREGAGARVGDPDLRPCDDAGRIEKRDPLALLGPLLAALEARRHHRVPIVVERRQLAQGGDDLGGQNVGVIDQRIRAYFQHISRVWYPIWCVRGRFSWDLSRFLRSGPTRRRRRH